MPLTKVVQILFKTDATDAGKRVDSLTGSITKASIAVTAVAAAFDKASARSLQLQSVTSALTISIDGARDATMGLVDDMTLMTSANNAVRLGVVKNSEEFTKLAGIASKLAISTGQDATKGVQDLTTALARQSPQILDNLGLQVDVTQANALYAASLGKSASQLTESEKKQAFLNAALAEGEKAAKAFNLEIDSGALTLQQFKTTLINLADQGVQYFTGAIGTASDKLGSFLEDVADFEAEYGLLGANASGIGISQENLNASFRRTKVRGLGGIIGEKGEQARATSKQNEEAQKLVDTMLRQNAEMRTSVEMLEANALANDKVTEALKNRRRATSRLSGGGGPTAFGDEGLTPIKSARTQDTEAFKSQLDEAKMVEAGLRAKEAQAEFEAEEHQKAQKRRDEEMRAREAEVKAVQRAEAEKRAAIEATMRAQIQAADAVQSVLGGGIGVIQQATDAYVRNAKRREQMAKATAGAEAIGIGILESVKAAAAFAGFNYVGGALHTAAAAFAFARGGMLLHQAGGGGRSSGFGGGGGGTGFGSGASFGDNGGATQSTAGNSGRPSSQGPVSNAQEESVQRSGRGGRSTRNRHDDNRNSGPAINLFHIGQLDSGSVVKLRQAIRASERRDGKANS